MVLAPGKYQDDVQPTSSNTSSLISLMRAPLRYLDFAAQPVPSAPVLTAEQKHEAYLEPRGAWWVIETLGRHVVDLVEILEAQGVREVENVAERAIGGTMMEDDELD